MELNPTPLLKILGAFFFFFFKADRCILQETGDACCWESSTLLRISCCSVSGLKYVPKHSGTCQLSVNQLTGIQCRPQADTSPPSKLPSDGAVKSKSSSSVDACPREGCSVIPGAKGLLEIYHSGAYQPQSGFPPFKQQPASLLWLHPLLPRFSGC